MVLCSKRITGGEPEESREDHPVTLCSHHFLHDPLPAHWGHQAAEHWTLHSILYINGIFAQYPSADFLYMLYLCIYTHIHMCMYICACILFICTYIHAIHCIFLIYFLYFIYLFFMFLIFWTPLLFVKLAHKNLTDMRCTSVPVMWCDNKSDLIETVPLSNYPCCESVL